MTLITVLAVLATIPALPYAAHGIQSPSQSTFDFKMSNSNNIAVVQGGEGSNTITVTLERGTAGFVLLSCGPLPTGATCSFNPQTQVPTFTSTLTIATSFSTPVGAVTVTAFGSGGGLTNSTQFTLNVKPAGSVGGTSLPTTGGNQLIPFAGIGLAALALIGAAVYGIRNRSRTGGSATSLKKL
ncbi:MAG TPA: LPXTG cell wall anchor domain-containing protein [Candidatus Bathyarchaeia archaeon]|nr:LPXTG cell wall anchor domain-containing protein [Candidatus Bathyarchaeia archaeon]